MGDILKNMKRQNNLYTLNGRFLSSSLQTNPSFIPITNVRFVSDSSQNNLKKEIIQ